LKKILLLSLLFLLVVACTAPIPTVAPVNTDTPAPIVTEAPPPTIVATISPTVDQVWTRYENLTYGYGISHPSSMVANAQDDSYVELGNKIVIATWTTDPLSMPGDRPIYETITDVQVGAYPARLVTGYLGSIGGFIPQQIRMYVFERNGTYFVFTLYALGLKVAEGDPSQIAPLSPEDVSRFDAMIQTVQFK
jgi:hypothetical protein